MKINNADILEIADRVGFDLIGFAKAEPLSKEVGLLNEWLRLGYQSGMSYMERNIEKKLDVKNILSTAVSVISLGVVYFKDEAYEAGTDKGKVSRYAWGRDYHLVIGEMLEEFLVRIKKIDAGFEGIPYADTGPVMDKAWGSRAGIGWLGKHTNLISREFGSWFFIANVISNREFEYSDISQDFCGSCRACIDACPTGAIAGEYILDSNKCISYLTIENKRDIDDEFRGKFDGWLFGCDICQEVCPWNNKFGASTKNESFLKIENKELDLKNILEMENGEFKKRFAESPIRRSKLKGMKRNARFILGEGNI